jgi:hypothetical protein
LLEIGKAVIKAVERHAQDVRFADDLTVLLARRTESRDAGFGSQESGTDQSGTDDGVPPIPGAENASLEGGAVGQREPRVPNPEPRIPPQAPGV